MAEGTIEKGFILDPEARLKSRIDEQSELICILKKRADQLLLESKSAEGRCRLAEKTNADLVMQVKQEKSKVIMLENRFNELAENHTEIIQYKEEYRAKAASLQKENDFLRGENTNVMTPLLAEKDKHIEEWQQKNNELYQRINELERENSDLSKEIVRLEKSETNKSIQINDLLSDIDKLNLEKKSYELNKTEELQALSKNFNSKIESLNAEKEKFFTTSLERGKELASKEDSIARLNADIFELKNQIKSINSEWKDAKNKLSKDATYKRLSKENEILKETLAEKERAFAAFTKHSNDLLEKERFMNKRLRSYSIKPE